MLFNQMENPGNAVQEPQTGVVIKAEKDYAEDYEIEPEMANSHIEESGKYAYILH